MSDDKKWKLVEKVVAAAFDEPNVTVERNVRLRSLRRKGGNGGVREIDVLITGELIGQKVHFAVECKHYKRKVDSHHIDSFIGKLQDVGLPTQTSIFVTTRGYTTQAIERAHEVGMKTLILQDGPNQSEKEIILTAIQSHIFLLCSITEITINSTEPFVLEPCNNFLFFDKDGHFLGHLPDFIWESWVRGTPPAKLGEYSYVLTIQKEARFQKDGSLNPISTVEIRCKVAAVLTQYKGEAIKVHLYNAHLEQTERYKVSVDFSNSTPSQYLFQTEAEMERFISKDASIAKLQFQRLMLPKIVMNQGLLWPINSNIIETIRQKLDGFCEDDFIDLTKSSGNNFFTFDSQYIEMLNKMKTYLDPPFKIELIQ